jgi:hypothetical protein
MLTAIQERVDERNLDGWRALRKIINSAARAALVRKNGAA